jgi:hypothetical protein
MMARIAATTLDVAPMALPPFENPSDHDFGPQEAKSVSVTDFLVETQGIIEQADWL